MAALWMATLGACQGSSPTPDRASTLPTTLALPTCTAVMPEPIVEERPEEGQQLLPPVASEAQTPRPEEDVAVDLAKADLSGRLNLPVEEIAARSIEAVQWPDTSLGCPKPGMMYAQVITPGYLIVLSAGGTTYVYHMDESKIAILCEAKIGTGEPVQGGDPAVQDGWPNQPRGTDVIVNPPTKKKP